MTEEYEISGVLARTPSVKGEGKVGVNLGSTDWYNAHFDYPEVARIMSGLGAGAEVKIRYLKIPGKDGRVWNNVIAIDVISTGTPAAVYSAGGQAKLPFSREKRISGFASLEIAVEIMKLAEMEDTTDDEILERGIRVAEKVRALLVEE